MKRTILLNTIAALLLLAPITAQPLAAAVGTDAAAAAVSITAAERARTITGTVSAVMDALTACAGTDLRIRSGDTYKSRPDKSVHHDLEQFVETLSGLQLAAIVLAIVLPVSIFVSLLAIFLFGGRCENCGRHRAMRTKHSEDTDSHYTTKNGRPIYVRNKTRVCKYCGHTDTLEHYGR